MISQEEIENFLVGNDPEEYIVSVEYDYVSDKIYKIKEVPGKGKQITQNMVSSLRNFVQTEMIVWNEALPLWLNV